MSVSESRALRRPQLKRLSVSIIVATAFVFLALLLVVVPNPFHERFQNSALLFIGDMTKAEHALSVYVSDVLGWEEGEYEVVALEPIATHPGDLSSNPMDISVGYLGLYRAELDHGGQTVCVEFDPDLADGDYEDYAYFGGDDSLTQDVEDSIEHRAGDAARAAGLAPSSVAVQLATRHSSAGTALTYHRLGSFDSPFEMLYYGPWGTERQLVEEGTLTATAEGGCSIYIIVDDSQAVRSGSEAYVGQAIGRNLGVLELPGIEVWVVPESGVEANDGASIDFDGAEDVGQLVWTSTSDGSLE